MNRRLFLAVVAVSFAFIHPASPGRALAADGPSPEAILQDIYGAYGPDTFPEGPEGKYFSPDLLAKYEAVVDGGGDDPELGIDFDVFLDAQDIDQVGDLKLTTDQTSDTKTVVEAQFSVFGEDRDIRFDFVKTAEGWKIDDMDWGDDEGTLRMFLDQLAEDQKGAAEDDGGDGGAK